VCAIADVVITGGMLLRGVIVVSFIRDLQKRYTGHE
jgi:hypothetical protein